MSDQDTLQFMPLDLDIFSESERFMTGTRLGSAFSEGIRAYLRAVYNDAIEHFRAALIAAYVEGEDQDRIYARERAIITCILVMPLPYRTNGRHHFTNI